MEASATAVKRVTSELRRLEASDEFELLARGNSICTLRMFIRGPDNTPYAGCVFAFTCDVDANYPHKPPAMQLLTTDAGRVRLNPNLYAGGKVCLSLLGTWASSDRSVAWTPACRLTTLAHAVQSLMSADPFHNEPGFETCEATAKTSEFVTTSLAAPTAIKKLFAKHACCRYAVKIRHEAVRLGVVQALLAALAILQRSNGSSGFNAVSKKLKVATDPATTLSASAVCRQVFGESLGGDDGGAAPPRAKQSRSESTTTTPSAPGCEDVICKYLSFVQRAIVPKAAAVAQDCEAVHAALSALPGGIPKPTNEPFEGTSNVATVAGGFRFAALASDVRLLSAALECRTSSELEALARRWK